MKKFIYLIIFLVVLGGVLVATCPDRTAHREAIKGVISEVVSSEMNKNPLGSTEIISIGTVFTMDLVDAYLKTNLMIKDHTFFNIGYVTYKDDFKVVSIGVLNHVFTVDEETARQLIKEKMAIPFK